VRFEDDKGLARNTKSADLAPDEAEARITFIAVEVKLEGGSPEAMLGPLRKEFGRPDHEGKPQPVGHFGFAFRMDVGPVMAAERRLAWTWKDVDRAVIASVTQYGEHTFGKLRDITMQLVYVDGLFAQEAVKEALEKERKRREQEQAAAAAEAIRKGISGGGKAPEAPKSGATSEKSLPIPDTLLGHWRVRGQHERQRWEGYLRLEKNTDAEARGELEWLEGHRPGLLPIKAVVIQSGRTNACTLVLRTDCDVLVGNGEPAAYAAVVSKNQKELHTGGWQGPEWSFSWRATKLENAKTKAKHASPAGKWVINGAASFALQEEGTLSPLRRISGVYTDRPWVAPDQIRTLHLAGSFNLHTRRVWFRAVRDSGESVFTYEGYLSADGTGMYGQDTDGQPWSALRDHLVSVQKPKWFLVLPVFELTPEHVSLKRATAFLEAMIDAYNIDLAIRTNSGEYRCLGRKTGNSRATSRLKELPKGSAWGSAWFEFKGNYPGDDTYLMKTFNTVLRKYGLPQSDAVLLVLPPALVEEMLGFELHHLKKEKKLDDRRHIRETTFEFTYDKQKRRLNLGVKSQSAVYALSW
jgi:antitoxin component of RelBE/YafQ-DinJ toxin-antitoxin module